MTGMPPSVEDFMVDSGISATIELVVETAKQLGLSTNQELIVLSKEGIEVSGRERKDTLLKCEDRIREQIENIFNMPIVNPIKDGKFCGSELIRMPSSYTGVFLYYVLKGLYQDYGVWFEGTPVALKSKGGSGATKVMKTYKTGGRVLTNKEAKLLMEMADMKYYAADIKSGTMTIEDASKNVAETYKKIKEYEDMGIVLPDKATGKVRYFIEEEEARADKSVKDNRYDIFKKRNLEITVPRLNEDYDMKCNHHKKYATSIKNVAGIVWQPDINNTADGKGTVSNDDIFKSYDRAVKMAKEEIGVLGKDFKIVNTHICKQTGKGRMRIIVFDCTTSKGEQVLIHTDAMDMVGVFRS